MLRRIARGAVGLSCASALGLALLAAPPSQAADPPPRPLSSGWFGWWATEAQAADLAARNGGATGEVNIFWWFFDGPGRPLCTYDNDAMSGNCVVSSTPWTTRKFQALRTTLQGAGVRVLASFTDLDPDRAGQLAAYIATPENRRAFARKVRIWAKQAGVDGVDLDWENFAFNDQRDTWPTTKASFISMVRWLSRELHAAGLTLSVTVPAGWQPFVSASGAGTEDACGEVLGPAGSPNPGTGYCVYAWQQIIGHVDRLRIMAYDYSWDSPGPIGPQDWAARVIDSAVAQVGRANAEKIWIGEPQYGRNWPLKTGGRWVTEPGCPADWVPATTPVRTSPTIEQAVAIAARESATPTWDPVAAEWTYRYFYDYAGSSGGRPVTCGVQREVWYADTRSAQARVRLAMGKRIGGIAVWQFGQVTPDFYPAMARLAQRWAKAATGVRVRADAEATYDTTVPVRVVVTSAGERVPGAATVLRFTPAGTTAPVTVSETVTDASGGARFSPAATQSGSWSAHVRGDWGRRLRGGGPASTVVAPVVSARAITTAPAVDERLRVRAAVRPEIGGFAMALQRRTGDGWRTEARATTRYDGTATLSYVPAARGDVILRVVALPSEAFGRGVSPSVRVSVGP
ncbi:MAG: glycosyl hydrolase family 18 protein [bacterium]